MFSLHDTSALKVIQDIAGQKKIKVYLVGGFLRDCLLSRPCLDLDFAVEKDAVSFARAVARRIKGAFILLDQEHGCGRVAKKQDGRIYTFDFADFRAPTLLKDLAHRDFTINTLSLDVQAINGADWDQRIKDFKKAGPDLRAKRVRMVSVKTFAEDPLRLLRAFSHQAVLNFKIEARTLQQIKKDRGLIRGVSYERIRDELFKILASPRAAATFRAMDRIGLLEEVIPQITVMFNVKQGGYHHLDVWPHSLEVVAQFEKVMVEMNSRQEVRDYFHEELAGQRPRYALIKLAALLHDIGKPQTRKKEQGRTSFHGHEIVGKHITRHVAKLLKLSTRERFVLEDMVLWHLRPGYLSNFKQPSEKAVYRYFRDTKEEAVSVLLLSLADQRSTRGPLTTQADQRHHEKICLGLVDQFFDRKKETPLVRLLTGYDLIKKLKLKPSPLFGKILGAVEEAQAMGSVSTREEALRLARKVADES